MVHVVFQFQVLIQFYLIMTKLNFLNDNLKGNNLRCSMFIHSLSILDPNQNYDVIRIDL